MIKRTQLQLRGQTLKLEKEKFMNQIHISRSDPIVLLCLILLGASLIFSPCLSAATINAASCEQVDVQAAIDAAVDGDIVQIPAGTCQWGSAISLSKEIIIQGAGIDLTIIKLYGFNISSGTDNWRITGLTWDGESQAGKPFSITTAKNWRIDHIKFYDYASNIMQINGYSYGLIDNSEFIDVAGEIITIYGDGTLGWARSQDLTSIADADRFTNGTIYIEDCTFIQSARSADNAVDSNNGARWVFRYNTVINNPGGGFENPSDLHGKCVTGWAYGTVVTEVYKNTIIDNGGHWIQTGFNVRGGTGVIFNNEVPSTWNQLLKIYNERSTQLAMDGFSCKDKGPCGSIGSCTTTADNPSAPYCDEQVNNFYIWGNTKGGVAYGTASVTGGGCVPEHVVAGRDFWNDGTKYPDYVEYTYPHPLTLTSEDNVVIITTSLPTATVDEAYSQTLTASGGTEPYTWALFSGSLPDGVFLLSDGTISGTPITEGTYIFTIQVADSGTNTATQELSIIVEAAVVVNTPPVLDAIVDITVNENETITITPSATDADGDTLTYSVQGLPIDADYDFDPQTGALTWRTTYEEAGAYDITFTVDDGRD